MIHAPARDRTPVYMPLKAREASDRTAVVETAELCCQGGLGVANPSSNDEQQILLHRIHENIFTTIRKWRYSSSISSSEVGRRDGG